jgi:phage portal protein BeeE
MAALYESSPLAYSCISANAREAASIGAQVQRREGTAWFRTEHDLDEFLMSPSGPIIKGRPAEPPQWTWSQLIAIAASHLYLVGNSYQVPTVVDNGRKLTRLLPLIADTVDVQTDATSGYPTSYSSAGKTYHPSQVVHTMFTSPLSLSQGHAPVQAAITSMDVDYAANQRIMWNLDNKVSPGVIITVAGFMGMTDTQKDTILADLSANYTAATADGTPLVTGDGTGYATPPDQRAALDYSDVRSDAARDILAVMHTPPPVVGVYDNATLNNFGKAFELWWLIALFPLLVEIYEAINRQLIWPVYGTDVRLWYDTRNSPIADLIRDKLIASAAALVAIGYPPNIAAAYVGLDIPHVPELDQPLQNLTVAGRT